MTIAVRDRIFRNAVVFALMLSLGAPRSWAWGREGHRLTALVAEQFLTPAAKAQIAELLHGETLADVASWADDYRTGHAETAKWHFVDMPSAAAAYDRDRDCPVSPDPKSPWRDCVTDRILYFEGQLADTTLSPRDRATALKFLVHFIGDVHQPFHTVGEARGGNDVKVFFLGSPQCGTRPCNLHAVWDDSIIEDQGMNDTRYLAHLLEEIKANHWEEKYSGGDPVSWTNASHHYAVLAEVPNGTMLSRQYVTEETKVVDAELALGGLRLAHVLNRILGAAPEGTGLHARPTEPPAAPQQP
jgi:hypothetical protein